MSEQKKPKKNKYKAIIIGAGRIAAQFDSPNGKDVLTHAHAYCQNQKTELAGFFDINKSAAKAAAKKWSCSGFDDLEQALIKIKPDIISICTPDHAHFSNLMEVVKYKPKIVICEKPFTAKTEDAQRVIRAYKDLNIPILINYSRRFDKTVQTLKKEVEDKKYGKIICSSGIYTKGILHNGSHLIDLSRFLFGEIKDFSVFYAVNDYDKKDKSVAGFLKYENCPQFHLMVGDERQYSIFELDIIFEKKRICFYDFGFYMFVQEIKNDPLFKGFKALGELVIKKTSLTEAMSCLIQNAVDFLENKTPLLSDMESAYQTQNICHSKLKNFKI